MIKVSRFIGTGIVVLVLLLLLVGQIKIGNYDQSDAPNATFVSVLGESLRYKQAGSGRDILFIHGTPGSLESWSPVFESLAQGFRVTSYDRPGHGYSSANDCDYTIAQNAAIVEGLIKELKLIDPLIVGHSYGGSIAAHLATRSDDLSDQSKLVIIDSPLYGHEAESLYKMVSTPTLGKGIAVLSKYTIGSQKIDEGLRTLMVAFPDEQLDDFLATRTKLWLQPKVTYSTSCERTNYEANLKEISPDYADITHDMTIITGTDPDKTLHDDCLKMKENLPSASLIVLENTGHFIQFEKTTEVLNIVRRLMTEKDGQSVEEELIFSSDTQ